MGAIQVPGARAQAPDRSSPEQATETADSGVGGKTHSAERRKFSLVLNLPTGATSCPDRQTLAAEVAGRVQHSAFDDDAERGFEVRVWRQTDVWLAEILVVDASGPRGKRVIQSESEACEALFSAIALALALSIDPDVISADDGGTLGAPEEAAQTASEEAPVDAEPEALPSPRSPAVVAAAGGEPPDVGPPDDGLSLSQDFDEEVHSAHLDTRVILGMGVLPQPTAGAEIAFALHGKHFGVNLTALYLSSGEAHHTDPAERRLSADLTAGGLEGTLRVLGSGSFDWLLSAGLLAGASQVIVSEPGPKTSEYHSWAAASLGTSASYVAWRWLRVDVGLRAAPSLLRREYRVPGDTFPVFSAREVGFIGHLGLRAALP